MKLRIATRASDLALTQTRWVAARIREHAPDVEIEEITVTTKGDKVLDKPLAAIGGKGLFVSEVEALVVNGQADLAVHSLKDVPGDVDLAEGMDLVCLPVREDPHDVLLTRDGSDLDDLPAGVKVGTTSLRRIAQLSIRRPDLAYVNLRGNVGTRLRRLDEGEFHAIILAAAGLKRLGLLEGRPHRLLSTEACLPAVGQGVLAIEARADDARVKALLAPLEDARTRIAVEAERKLLRVLEGSCRVPMAGHATLSDDGSRLELTALVGSIDGRRVLTASGERYLGSSEREARIASARALGEDVAKMLLERGAREVMLEAESEVLAREKNDGLVRGRGPKWPN